MAIINAEFPYVTVVNVFTVQPDKADELIATAVATTQSTLSRMAGFVSSSFHKSLDGQQVVNYAQWESQTSLQASMQQPAVQQMLQAMGQLATAAPNLYKVTAVVESNQSESAGGN